MVQRRLRNIAAAGLVGFMILGVSVPAAAQNSMTSKDRDGGGWKFDSLIYLWGAGIGGKAANGGDIDIEFEDLIKNLDIGFMTTLGARKGKWSLFGDFIYMDVTAKNDSLVNLPIAGGVPAAVFSRVSMKSFISTVGGGYRVKETETFDLDLVAGVRYLYIKSRLDFQVTTALAPLNIVRTIGGSGDEWNGIIGVRGKMKLNEKWYLPYYLDVGAGDRTTTWQAYAGVGYKLKRVDLVLGYRHLNWNFDDNVVFSDMNLSGFLLGVKIRF